MRYEDELRKIDKEINELEELQRNQQELFSTTDEYNFYSQKNMDMAERLFYKDRAIMAHIERKRELEMNIKEWKRKCAMN